MPSDVPDTPETIRANVERLSAELDNELQKLEGTEYGQEWKLRARLLRLEAEYLTTNKPAPSPVTAAPQVWGRIKSIISWLTDTLVRLAPITTPIIIAVFGLWFTGTTKEFLEIRKVEISEQQLDLATIQALDGHFQTFRNPETREVQAKAAASLIAYFGPRAIVPLVAELGRVESANHFRAKAIREALLVSALHPSQRDQLCSVLATVVKGGGVAGYSDGGKLVANEIYSGNRCDS